LSSSMRGAGTSSSSSSGMHSAAISSTSSEGQHPSGQRRQPVVGRKRGHGEQM
jgi:hypothetical protein